MIPDVVLWLPPALFVLHDAEEVVLCILVVTNNSRTVKSREFVFLGVVGVAAAAVNLFAIHLAAAKLSRG